MSESHGSINIEVLKGGFILSYELEKGGSMLHFREIVQTPRKLQQRVKELIDSMSLVKDE